MMDIGKSWPIPWTVAATVLAATHSTEEALRRLEQLEQEESRQWEQRLGAIQRGNLSLHRCVPPVCAWVERNSFWQ